VARMLAISSGLNESIAPLPARMIFSV
jgi:hypothetical protein